MDGQVASIKEITGKGMRLIPIVVSVTQHRRRGREKGEELDGEASDESLSKRVCGGYGHSRCHYCLAIVRG